MKVRNKGKVYPTPSSSSSSSLPPYSVNTDAAVLKLLPAAILALLSVLSLEDRQVLAYMITRSINSTNPSSAIEENKKNNKKSNPHHHKTPVFGCECFDCYTTYWFRWDSSPNRELIHHAIEAFEEHLNKNEQPKNSNNRGKKREKMRRRVAENPVILSQVAAAPAAPAPEIEPDLPEIEEGETLENVEDEVVAEEEEEEEAAVVVRGTAAGEHKGLARKVLPDVLGLFNSRLWSLWSPNV